MNFSFKHSTALVTVALTMAFTAASKLRADEKPEKAEQTVSVSDLPKPVTDAASKAIDGGKITGAEKTEKKHALAYELDMTAGDAKYELVITADGSVLLKSQDIDAKDLPAAVIAGIKKDMPDAEITAGEKEIKAGKTEYEVDVKSNGKAWEAKLDAEGNLQSKKIDDDKD